MSLIFYNLFLVLYSLGIRAVSPFNSKARRWLNGRKNGLSLIQSALAQNTDPVIWMHCASLGEFEQGRPLLESIKNEYPNHKIVLTFFSPSGYEIRKNYVGADWIFYLPMDNPIISKKFIEIVNPKLVLWVKYEYWYYFLTTLHRKQIPVLLISGIFRPSQPFFKWYGKLWHKMLGSFKHLFVQTQSSLNLLQESNLGKHATVTGDTRFDRVFDIASNFKPLPHFIEEFCGTQKVVVAGSTWEEDEDEWVHYVRIHPEIKFIFAPHEIDEENIQQLQKQLPGSILYSAITNGLIKNIAEHHVIIVDNIGILSKLYHYANIAYVGGGFNDSGIHNILEAAVYGIPVIFGPEYEKFAEAIDLVELNGAYSIENALELEQLMDRLLSDSQLLETSSKAAKEYVNRQRGATSKIMKFIYANRLLTN